MIVLKVAAVFLLALTVGADKKIELQDIENDNLRSENEKDLEKSDTRPQTSSPGSGPGSLPLDFLKNGFLRYFEGPAPTRQPQRYVHQYAVTEPPERPPPVVSNVQYSAAAPQQAMVGYLSNVPMQIYLVPQYYTDQSDQTGHHHPHARVAGYQTAPEAVQTQTNYIEVPTYVAPTAKTYVPQYNQQVAYVGYPAQPTIAPPQATVTPVVTYQVPLVQYTSAVVQPTSPPKTYYQGPPQYTETNTVEEVPEHEEDQRQYSAQTESPYRTPPEFPRHYNSRTPIREEYRGPNHNAIAEIPHPNPLILKSPPPHLAHIPKSLPIYRPLTKPVYQGGPAPGYLPSGYPPRSPDYHRAIPFRRPTSLLDSYIPSSVQVEYLKRGLVKEPLAVYDAIVSGRVPHPIPRHYERGFLPNQMYHTGAGGITYGHHKRTAKNDKTPH